MRWAVTQDTFLFTGTVRENLCYGRGKATEEEMIAAAKAVNAHSFIMKMEKGYDTRIERAQQPALNRTASAAGLCADNPV